MRPLLTVLLALFSLQGCSPEWNESPEVEGLFPRAGVAGTFVLYDVDVGRLVGHN